MSQIRNASFIKKGIPNKVEAIPIIRLLDKLFAVIVTRVCIGNPVKLLLGSAWRCLWTRRACRPSVAPNPFLCSAPLSQRRSRRYPQLFSLPNEIYSQMARLVRIHTENCFVNRAPRK